MSTDSVMQVDFAFFFLKLSSECFDSHEEQDIFAIESNCRRGRKATYKSQDHDKKTNLLNILSEETLPCTGEILLQTLALIPHHVLNCFVK